MAPDSFYSLHVFDVDPVLENIPYVIRVRWQWRKFSFNHLTDHSVNYEFVKGLEQQTVK